MTPFMRLLLRSAAVAAAGYLIDRMLGDGQDDDDLEPSRVELTRTRRARTMLRWARQRRARRLRHDARALRRRMRVVRIEWVEP